MDAVYIKEGLTRLVPLFVLLSQYKCSRLCDGILYNVGSSGDYWSSTPYGSDGAGSLGFYTDDVGVYNYYRCNGLSVRLVQD